MTIRVYFLNPTHRFIFINMYLKKEHKDLYDLRHHKTSQLLTLKYSMLGLHVLHTALNYSNLSSDKGSLDSLELIDSCLMS
jgi:hypothetical protein